jgi:ParB-like chromosome segregation protein Spo0J
VKVSQLKKNPANPRQIKGDKLDKLKASIGGFQKMMALRPLIVDENNVVLVGNMRLAAIKALGLKEIPDEWVKKADDLTADEKAQFIITDNSSFGEYDWDAIANEWSDYPLADWGLDVPGYEAAPEFKEYTEDVENEVQFIECPECNHRFPK